MLIAHLSDLHLGYRAYNRVAAGGVNVRERDVARAFRNAIDAIIALEPQLIVVAGDIFHSVRPSNSAIADAFHHFARLSARLSDTQIVLVGGDHDTPRSVESGSILRLFKEIPRVSVVDQGAREIEFSDLGVAVLGVSHSGLLDNPLLKPSSKAESNVLVLHGSYDQEVLRTFHDYSGAYFDLTDLHAESWDYIALGHYHEFAELRPNAVYSGALEHTSNNIWREEQPKGFVTFDTVSRVVMHHAVESRPVIDLKPISNANQHTADGLNAEIRKRVEGIKGGLRDKIVRLIIYDIPREMMRDLDHRLIRDYKSQALHFQLDTRRPPTFTVLSGQRGRSQTLEQELENFVLHQWHPSTKEIDKTRVLGLARKYLHEAGTAEAAELNAFSETPEGL